MAKTPAVKGADKGTALTSSAALDALRQEMQTSGTGLENVTAADLLIPRLTILQGLSPQVTEGKPEFDPNAKVGMIYDVGLQEGWNGKEGIHIIPVYYVKQWLEWAPRSSGKGLQGIHDNDAILDKTEKDERNRPVLPNGNYVAETAQFYCLNMTAGGRKSFLPMASTQIKKGKRLLTLATGERITGSDGKPFVPPLFYRSYHLTTVPESNNEGNWMGWKIERGPAMDELPDWQNLMLEIRSFREALGKGTIRGDIEAMAEEVRTVDHSDDGAM